MEQSFSSQKYEIMNWTQNKGIVVDKWIMESVSGTTDVRKRKLGWIIKKMKPGDVLISTEISRLGRNMLMIMSVLNECSRRGISIYTIKDNFELSNNINSKIIAFAFALAAEIERNLISQRTREALADKKAAGVVLGRPKGSSKKKEEFVKRLPEIISRREKGESLNSIARRLGVNRNTLSRYLSEQDK